MLVNEALSSLENLKTIIDTMQKNKINLYGNNSFLLQLSDKLNFQIHDLQCKDHTAQLSETDTNKIITCLNNGDLLPNEYAGLRKAIVNLKAEFIAYRDYQLPVLNMFSHCAPKFS